MAIGPIQVGWNLILINAVTNELLAVVLSIEIKKQSHKSNDPNLTGSVFFDKEY